VVRQLTISNIENIKKFIYLKNGAMYSIFFLGLMMILKGFRVEIPEFVTPVVTLGLIGFFYIKSLRHAKKMDAVDRQTAQEEKP
jgi:hypothetical protein